MPVEFLSDEQAVRYGRYHADPSPEQLARFFYLSPADRAFLATYRLAHTRFGCAVQLCTRGATQVRDFAHQYFLDGAPAAQFQQLLNPLPLLVAVGPANLLRNLGHDLHGLALGHGAQGFYLPLVILLRRRARR